MDTTQPAQAPDAVQRVVVRPGAGQAALYTLLATASTSIALYGYLRRHEYVWMAWAIGLSTIATWIVASQVLAPQLWTLVVDRLGVRGRISGFWIERSFVGVRMVEVVKGFGEPWLVIRGHGGPKDRRRVPLPIGCDQSELRALLAQLEGEAAIVSRPGPFDRGPDAPGPSST